MKIGPVDIRNHSFSKKMRGVDEAEVRAYLDLVADRLEECVREVEELRDSVERAHVEIREYKAMERTLRDSLVSAERVTEERLALAEREGRLVVKNAEVESERILAHAREMSAKYRADIEDLRRQRTTFLERFRALLSSQSKILEASARDFNSIENPEPPKTESRVEPRPEARAESRAEARGDVRPEVRPSASPHDSRPDARASFLSVPFEPVSSRTFERASSPPASVVAPVIASVPAAASSVHPSSMGHPAPDSSIASYLGEEGLFAAPATGDSPYDERRGD